MTHRIVSRFPLSLWVPGVAILALGLLFVYASDPTQVGSFVLGRVLLAFQTVGALVASHQPAKARDETDLDAFAEQLVEVMQETMQPESVALWLKPAGDQAERPGQAA